MKNPVVHFEILGQNHETLQQYYRDLFEWKIENMSPEMPYGVVESAEGEVGIGGGIGASPDGAARLTFYVQVEDIDASLTRAVELGGKTVAEPMTIPGVVTFALFEDPEGNLVGLVASQAPE